jgi:DNA-directed RNA polymerase specialized sigma24 family protein
LLIASTNAFDLQLPPLVRGTLEGDPDAWHGLWLLLGPFVLRIAGRWRHAGPLAHREDDRDNIFVSVMDHLHDKDFRRLHGLREAIDDGAEPARSWIATVTIHLTLDYARGHDENLGADSPGGPPRWAALLPLPEDVEEQLPVSIRAAQHAEAHRIFSYAERHLERPQLEALHCWIRGYDHAEVAEALGLHGPDAARRTIAAAVKRLRRACGETGETLADGAPEGAEKNRPVRVLDRPRRSSRKK